MAGPKGQIKNGSSTKLDTEMPDKVEPSPSTNIELSESIKSLFTVLPLNVIDDPPLSIRNNPQVSPEFISSVKENSVLEPILVRPTGNGRYERISGQRRVVAAKEAGLTEIPCRVLKNLSGKQLFGIAFQENMYKAPDFMGAAEYVISKMKELEMTQKEAAQLAKIGEKRLSNILRVYRDPVLRERVREGMPFDQALDLLGLKRFKGEDWKRFAGEPQIKDRKEIREQVRKAKVDSGAKPRRNQKCSLCNETTGSLELRSLRLCQSCIKIVEEFERFFHMAQEQAKNANKSVSEFLKLGSSAGNGRSQQMR